MKKILSILAFVMALSSCKEVFSLESGEGYEVDWYPVSIVILATDGEGNSIISSDMPGMSLTFKEKTYTVRDWAEVAQAPSRVYPAVLYGLFARQFKDEDGTVSDCLYFGEIDGAADMDEDIVLKWPDASSDTIHYHCSDHRTGSNPSCNRTWTLNGEEHEGSVFRFVKAPAE